MPEIARSRLEFPSREKMMGWALTRWRALTRYSTVVIIIMSNFLVVLGCSDDDSVSLSSPTVPVMSVSVSPANSSSLPLIKGAIAQNSNY